MDIKKTKKRLFLVTIVSLLFILINYVSAARVCVVAYYNNGKEPDSKCIEIEEGKDGYELMQKTGWDLLWSPESIYGHMLCKINGIGTGISGNYCEYKGEFWNIVLNMNHEWVHLPVGLDGQGPCWNYDINSWAGHYCTRDNDVLGFAFGGTGSIPDMFIIDDLKVYVDKKIDTSVDENGGLISNRVRPGSEIKIKIKLKNMYNRDTDISIRDVKIDSILEEINDGEDIETEVEEFDIDAGSSKKIELDFRIPLEVDAGNYNLNIKIKAEDDALIKYEKNLNFDVRVEKEKHKLYINELSLDKDSYRCGDIALLNVGVINIGGKEEDASLLIESQPLGLNTSESLYLSDEPYEGRNKFFKEYSIKLGKLAKGVYPINAILRYGLKVEFKQLMLKIEACNNDNNKTKTITTERKDQGSSTKEPKEERFYRYNKYENKKYGTKEERTENKETALKQKRRYLVFIMFGFMLFLTLLVAVLTTLVFFLKKR